MIVRILGEGQYRLDNALIDELNELDARLQIYLAASDSGHFRGVLGQMAALIHARGELLADEELLPSDAIVPPEDASVNEVRELLSNDGLIPD